MTNVPSNLIPTRVTQLPLAPVADPDSLMMIIYQGNNYQIRVGDLLSVAGVPITTQVIAGTAMAGGGALSGNVTLSVAGGGIGTTQLANSGVTAGVYGTATDIPVFTVDATGRVMSATTIPATISGYVPTTRQVIAGTGLTGGGALSANVTLSADLSSSTPLTGFQSGSAGAATTISRSDHVHPQVDLSDDDQVDNLLGLNNGGTAKSLVAAAGAIVWSGADGLYIGPVGSSGQVLVSGGAGAPTWGSAIVVSDQAANVVYAGPTAGPAAPTAFRALVNADLPASGVSANTYGSSSAIPVVTVNSKGVITGVTTASFTGGLSYQGSWNASTNTPTLVSSVGVNGDYYIVSVAGSTNLDGVTDWQIGDWAIFNGATWQKIDQTNLVSSVNGQVGVVSIAYADLAGSIPTWNQNTTGTAAGLSATLAIASGGSGQTTAQAAMNAFAGAVTSGSYLRGNGTNVVMNTIQVADVPTLNQNTTGTAAGLSATLAIASGGTGQTTASAAFNALSPVTTTGDLILGTGVNTASRLAIGSNGYLLTSDGTTASWAAAPAGGVTSVAQTFTGGIVSVAGSPITTSGTLALTVAGTSGGIPYFSSGTTWATSAALTQYGVVYGGGAGAAPVSTAAGTAGYALIANSAAAPTFQQVSLTSGVTGTLPIANGGTNSTATATAGGAGYGTGTAHAYTAAGTAGQILTSAGASAPAWGSLDGGTF